MTQVETKYLPAAWLDEVVPPAQLHPNLFVHHSEASGWHLRDPDEDEVEAIDSGWFTKIRPGDIVPFSANRVFGDFVVTINADGSYSTDRPVPTEAFGLERRRPDELTAIELYHGETWRDDL